MVMELLRSEEATEEDSADKPPSILDVFFEDLALREPDHLAVKQYQIYKQAPAKTASSILISVGVRLAAFNLPSIAGLTSYDELDLSSLGEKKVALFCLIPDNDTSLNFLIGMLYTQAFQELYYQADRVHGGRLPVHVHCLMDEFPNIAMPSDFDKLVATMRSREISVSIVIQNMAQLRALYKEQWESICGNCDHFLYLGGNEAGTHEYISKALGKASITVTNHSQSKGKSGSYSSSEQVSGRELLLPDEVRTMDNTDCILFIRGERPIMDKKYDILRHPHARRTPDGGGEIYRHGELTCFSEDLAIDMSRIDDYQLLTADDILGTAEIETEESHDEK
jgi:type IV secretion system protein VirD4